MQGGRKFENLEECGKLQPNISFVTNCSFLKSNRYLCTKASFKPEAHSPLWVCLLCLFYNADHGCMLHKSPWITPLGVGASLCWTHSKITCLLQRKLTRSKETKRLNPEKTMRHRGHQRPRKKVSKNETSEFCPLVCSIAPAESRGLSILWSLLPLPAINCNILRSQEETQDNEGSHSSTVQDKSHPYRSASQGLSVQFTSLQETRQRSLSTVISKL